MLGKEERIGAKLLGEDRLVERLADDASVVSRILALRKQEGSYSHDDPIVAAAAALLSAAS